MDKAGASETTVAAPAPKGAIAASTQTSIERREATDQQSSRLKFDAMVREYDALGGEVRGRIQKQQDITNFAIALAAGAAALGRLFPETLPSLASPVLQPFYPAISVLFSAFALLTLDHEANIALIYRYIDTELRPRMQRLIGGDDPGVWGWNQSRANWQHHSGRTNVFFYAMSWAKYAMTVLPSIGLAFLYWRIHGIGGAWWQRGIFSISVVLLAFVLWTALFVALQYNKMGQPQGNDSTQRAPSA